MINILNNAKRTLLILAAIAVFSFTTACGTPNAQTKAPNPVAVTQTSEYGQLALGNSAAGQDFGSWVIRASKGLISDAYVRDSNKLGVVISSKVMPKDVKALTQSLAQGFRHNFPNQDLTVLVYAPDKKLVLTARYDTQSKQIDYQQAS
jgi:pyruvate carboxylase